MVNTPQKRLKYFPDSAYDLVVFGSSAGGIHALMQIFAALPSTFPCAIAVVQHLFPTYPSQLTSILSRETTLKVKQALNGDILHAATIYIAPPNYHLLIGQDRQIEITQTEPVQHVRPSVNLLFTSAATVFKERVLAVVLSGMGSDGAAGVQSVHTMGGKVITQDEATASFFGMPGAAIKTGVVDLVLPLEEIAPTILALVNLKGTQ